MELILIHLSTKIPNHADVVSSLRAFRDRYRLPWKFVVDPPPNQAVPPEAWQVMIREGSYPVGGQGVCYLFSEARQLGTVPELGCCRLAPENFGWLACRHFLDRGYRHLVAAYVRETNRLRPRCDAFQAACRAAGFPGDQMPPSDKKDLLLFIERSPKPMGIFCPSDGTAAWLRNLLNEASVPLRKRIGLVGCGDHPRITISAEPELSSVALPWYSIGQAAGHCLQHLIQGTPERFEAPVLHPVRVVDRTSTLQIATRDPLVAQAEKWLRRHPDSPQPLAEVAAELGVSVHTVCRHFRNARGMSPKAFHLQQRLEKSCRLLGKPQLSIGEIALRCGFRNSTAYGVAFKRQYGIPPRIYRAERKTHG